MSSDLATLLSDHPAEDGEALVHTISQTATAGQVRAAAARTAAQLEAAGIGKHFSVGVQLPPGPEAVAAMFGIWLARGVFVPLNPRLPNVERDHALDATRTSLLIDEHGLGETGVEPVPHDDATAFVLWTSGTTGRPKPVLHTHSGYFELIDRVLGSLRGSTSGGTGRKRPAPNLIPVPLSLNAGVYNLLFGLRAGAEIVLMGSFATTEFAELVARFGVRSTVLPPAAITMLNDDEAVTDLTPLSFVRSITAPLSPLQARRFTERFGVVVLNSYGQAELGEVIGWSAADAREHPDKLGAAGRPHEGVDLAISAMGELLVRPPKMAAGYASGEDLGARIDPDGFVRTGDIAHIDSDGFVWIDGRIGNVINRGGNKVFPEQVEEVIRLHPSVSDAAVVPGPDARLGEVPVALVVGDADAGELEALCREHLVPYKVPAAFHAVPDLPTNAAGKLLRNEIHVPDP